MSLAARLPIPRSLRVEALLLAEDGLAILASSEATDVRCPLCGRRSDWEGRREGRSCPRPFHLDGTISFSPMVHRVLAIFPCASLVEVLSCF